MKSSLFVSLLCFLTVCLGACRTLSSGVGDKKEDQESEESSLLDEGGRTTIRGSAGGEQQYEVEGDWGDLSDEIEGTDLSDILTGEDPPVEQMIGEYDHSEASAIAAAALKKLQETEFEDDDSLPDTPRIQLAEWMRNPRKARAKSKKENKPLLFFFLADWVPNSVRLKRELSVSKEFHEFATQNLVVTYLNFPMKFTQSEAAKARVYNNFAKHFEVNGYPSVVLISPDGEVLRKITGYSFRWDAKKFVYQISKSMK